MEKRKTNESEETEEIKTFPSILTCCKDSRPCPTQSQYQLDAPVTQDTQHLCLTQPPLFNSGHIHPKMLSNLSLPLTLHIPKTRLCNFDPLKPHFCIVKLGFTGVYTIFLISAEKHRLWVLVKTTSLRQF